MKSSVILHKLKGIFAEKTPHKLPETWFKHIYLTENHYIGIEIVAKSERISRLKANHMILDLGFKAYYARKLQEHNEDQKRREAIHQKRYPSRFVRTLKKKAKPEDKKILKNL